VANIKSQIKRNKTNEVARERNKAVKSELRTRTKNAVAAVGTENEEVALRTAIKPDDAHRQAEERRLGRITLSGALLFCRTRSKSSACST
jgi:ribosomal protein S20